MRQNLVNFTFKLNKRITQNYLTNENKTNSGYIIPG